MKCFVPGHRYLVPNFENKSAEVAQIIQFIHKEPFNNSSPELGTVADGTTTEEVLEVLIDRMVFLQGAFPCRENAVVITKLEEALMWLNKRTADRQKRNVEGKRLA